MERHHHIRSVARGLYTVPGMKTAMRNFARTAAQHLPLSVKNKWRLHNFFGEDTLPNAPILCKTPMPNGRSVTLELDLEDYLSRLWYYLGYAGYEGTTTALFCELLKTKSHVIDVGA